MSNPVDVVADAVIETSNDFRFPLTIGSRVRGEEKFTFIMLVEPFSTIDNINYVTVFFKA